MKFINLKTVNYAQHRDFDQKIDGTIVAVIGHNGVGKSNLLGAPHFALAGAPPDVNKAALLSWGAEGESGYVELTVEHNGTVAVITRHIDKDEAWFRVVGSKPVGPKIGKVNDAIREILGADKDVLRQTVFVRQAELDSVLFEDARTRELAFQRLLGIGDAAKIYDAVGKVVTRVPEPRDYAPQIEEAGGIVAGMDARLADLNARIAELKAKSKAGSADGESAAELRRKAAAIRAGVSAAARATEAGASVLAAAREVGAAEAALAQAAAPSAEARRAADARVADLRHKATNAEKADRAFARFKAAGEAVIAHGDDCPYGDGREDLDRAAELEKIAASESGTSAAYGRYLTTIATAEGDSCPLCGSPTDVAAIKKTLTEAVAECKKKGDDCRRDAAGAKTRGSAELAKRTRWLDAHRAVMSEFEAAQAAYDALGETEAVSPEDIAGAESEVARLSKLAGANVRAAAALDFARQNHARAAAELSRAEAACAGSEAGSEDDAARLETAAESLARTERDLASLSGSAEELAASAETARGSLERLKAAQLADEGSRAFKRLITPVRDWFHYGNGPRALAAAAITDLSSDVNKYLGYFTAPFEVVPADSFGFDVVFTDGRDMPPEGKTSARVLSGGERVQLAVAFRFACYCMFSSQLGVLSLDEPTVYLDQFNTAAFCSMLGDIRRMAAGLGLQVLLATHERGVMAYADTVIQLGA